MKKKIEKGFIALTSVLIIGAVVLVLGISLFHSALTDYSISTAYQSGQKAAFLADFCLKEGAFKLKENIDYIGGEDINVNNATCTINVKQINENTKEISSLGRAGDQPHFSRASRLVRYIIESSADNWNNSFATSNVEIVGDYLRLQRAEAKVIARITDLSDDWNNYFATSNVEITEDGSLVLSVIPPPTPTCGDGIINGSEQCDNNGQNGQVCTPPYGGSCSYCSNTCQTVTVQGPYCGDGIINGSEQCDNNGQNGQVCTPPYGGSCSYCSNTCQTVTVQGPYCGDGIINGSEQCDNNGQNGQVCTPPYDGSCSYCSNTCQTLTRQGGYCGDDLCQRGSETCLTCLDCCGPAPCVIADTLILTPSGYKKIQDLNVGDKVIGFDIEKNERVITEVKTKSSHTGLFPTWVYNGITFTWNHKVYVNNQWQYVAELAEKIGVFGGTVYNITTQTQNYFAKYGDLGIETLVHNKPIPY